MGQGGQCLAGSEVTFRASGVVIHSFRFGPVGCDRTSLHPTTMSTHNTHCTQLALKAFPCSVLCQSNGTALSFVTD